MTNKTSGFDPAAGKRIGSKPVFTYRYFSANSAKVKFLNQCGLDPKQKICLHVQTYRDPGKAVVSTPRGKKVADLQTSAESDTMTITAAPGLDLVLMTAIALVHQGAGHARDTRDNTTRQVNPRSTDPLLRSSVGTVLFAGSLPGSGTGL
ncbi:hypothetical protein OC845_002779 [Tilletia horrida]|nr:hypothetical protein OC845_002779 [Tilletia horrida]